MTRDTRDIDLKALFADDDAVSPVIGVILMVAITVILAAVIGTFVLGLGQQVQTTTPQVSIGFDYNSTNVTATHQGGETIPSTATVNLSVDGNVRDTFADKPFSAGDSLTGTYSSGDTVRVVWKSQTGERSAVLAKSTAP